MNINFDMLVTKEEHNLAQTLKTKTVIANRRYLEETKGIVVDGLFINTDRDSQNMINGAVVGCILDSSKVCDWKTPTGFIALDANAVKSVGMAVFNHVQACFNREKELLILVETGEYSDNLLEVGWPA